MIGKKNVVFGFLYLVLTASLGPYMVVNMFPDMGAAAQEKQAKVGRLQALKENNFEENLEPLKDGAIARANTEGLLAFNKLYNARQPIDGMKAGPHAHGNLEAVLNILAGLALCFIAVSPMFKQLISWVFIAGAVLHSGVLYALAFGIEWVSIVRPLGPWLVLLGLLLIGIAALMGFKGELVKDE
ncbi:MAG: DUF423 domain-containing protein [Gammaproteobacteria bacterium]|nr:DUF423 domain-containing protein [Gammaproteobacteria bacterium]MDH5778196.1 DUF423 domain-containing protein [Gammaproteobacteria bacterium]